MYFFDFYVQTYSVNTMSSFLVSWAKDVLTLVLDINLQTMCRSIRVLQA